MMNRDNKQKKQIKNSITFYGGAGTVTGANFLLTLGDTKILIDCGLTQGEKYSDEFNHEPFQYDVTQIDYLFATHAHADHIGLIPKLVKEGFVGTIFSTPATRDLSEVMFADAVKILAYESRNNKKGTKTSRAPLYEADDVVKTLSLWKGIDYHKKMQLNQEISVFLKDAGHILGSAMFEFTYKKDRKIDNNEEKKQDKNTAKIVFTGDLGNSPSPLLRDTEDITDADYIVMESVYGDRNHEKREQREELLKKAIEDISSRRGVLMIPSFSIERTQLLLYLINNFVEDGILPKIPVYLDSPLAIRVTDVFSRHTHLFNEGVQREIRGGDDIFDFPQFSNTKTVSESKSILRQPNPKIILAGSGMSSGGRILNHEKQYLSDSKNMLLLVGYQAVGTLGRLIQGGAKEITIDDKRIKIKAEIRTINGFSAHKDSDHLIEFVEKSKKTLKKVFVAMGEPKSSLFLVQRLRDYIGVNAVSPEKGDVEELKL